VGIDNASPSNVYVCGATDGKYLIIKYDSTGSTTWVVSEESGGAVGIAVDESSNVYVTGGSNNDIVTYKYDSGGNQTWMASYEGSNNDNGEEVTVDGSGNVYVAGFTQTGVGSDTDFITIKYDSSGNQTWARTLGTTLEENAYGIAVDDSGNVYVTGRYRDSNSYSDAVTIKYDSSGNQIWVASYDASNEDQGYDVAIDDSGNVFVGGITSDGNDQNFLLIKYHQN
jgi:hypothetical protein